MQDFEDKVAVITGAASGIGLGIAKRAVNEGMKVVIADIEEKALASAKELLKESGDNVLSVVTDVSKESDIRNLAQETIYNFGKVNLLCNNAGVGFSGLLWEASLAEWEWVMNVNLWGVIHGIRIFVPIMLEQDEDCHIVNTSSMAGLLATNYQGIYSMTKFGVVALSEVLNTELSSMNSKIKVSVLCPGFVKTNVMNSIRNAPENVPVPDVDTNTAIQNFIRINPEAEQFAKLFMSMWESGLSPDIAGDIVFGAIKDEAFYILTDTSLFFKNLIKGRMNGIIDAFKQNKPYKRKSIQVYK
ncbi:MAG: SDR family NAD(P)-dependent oxidoreductase [Promethearchaeota archaeon]